jgi:hypothetical protein
MSKFGFKHSEETKEKIRQARLGTHCSKETKEKIRQALLGIKLPLRSEEHRRKISEAKKGQPSPRKGVHLSEETKQKLREANFGKRVSEETKQKISESQKGRLAWNKGKTYSSPKQSVAMSGEGNSNWRGGISFELYSDKFTEELKESIRERDNFTCQECGIKQEEMEGYLKKLDIHHIDYDKHHNETINLISLCRSCHTKTGFSREDWVKYFKQKMVSYET